MPIDSLHPAYQKARPVWKLVSDVLEGESCIKRNSEAYLPLLAEQQPPEYEAYRDRALFVGVTERTHESLVGFLFRKDPTVVFPTELADLIDDCTLTGFAFYDYLKDVARATLALGRYGTLVDWDQLTQRPFLRGYSAEQIINWRTARVGSQVVLTQLVLTEISDEYLGMTGDDVPADDFVHPEFAQWRVFDLMLDDAGQPFVRCQVWRRKVQGSSTRKGGITGGARATKAAQSAAGADESWVQVSESFPTRRGTALGRIPFIFHGPNNHLPAVDKVPMENMARVNISHYRTSADLENGRHFTGLPTVWAAGFAGKDEKLYLGSTAAWVTDKTDAKCGFLEFTGQGLKALTDAIEEKQQQMATLGARMFDAPKGRGAEAYDTVRIKQTGETVTLTNASVSLTQSCSKVLQLALWWITPTAAQPEDLAQRTSVALNTEFVSTKLTSIELTAIVAAWQMKAISYETMFFNLQAGEMYPADTKIEDEAELIVTPTVDFNLMGNGQNGLPAGAAIEDTNAEPGVNEGGDGGGAEAQS